MVNKIGKIIYALMLTILLASMTRFVKAEGNYKLTVNSFEEVKPGEEITVKIRTENFEGTSDNLIGIKLDLFYDTDTLEFKSARHTGAVNGVSVEEDHPDEGRVRMGMLALSGIKKDEVIYKVKFKVKDNVSKQSSELKIEVRELTDSSGNEHEADVSNGVVNFDISGKNANSENSEKKEESGIDFQDSIVITCLAVILTIIVLTIVLFKIKNSKHKK